jgi:hypothetical protein
MKGANNFKGTNNTNTDENEDKVPLFKLLKLPNELSQVDIVWNIALECENAKVIPKAIDL